MELVEYVVLHLSHIPYKELIALSVMLKTEISDNGLEFCILFLQSAFRYIIFTVLDCSKLFIKIDSNDFSISKALFPLFVHFFRILSANALLKDAFREVGLVESLTWTVLHFISTDKSNVLSILRTCK